MDSGQKRKGGKVFGSLERGLDKVITMLTPSKKRGPRDGPRRIKVSAVILSHLHFESSLCPFCSAGSVLMIRLHIAVLGTLKTHPMWISFYVPVLKSCFSGSIQCDTH